MDFTRRVANGSNNEIALMEFFMTQIEDAEDKTSLRFTQRLDQILIINSNTWQH